MRLLRFLLRVLHVVLLGVKNLDTLFITTARWGMTQEQIDNNPSAGGLFSIKPGVIGLADNQFGG